MNGTGWGGREVTLRRPPSGLGQYLRAGLPRPGARPDAVPEVVLRLPAVRPDPGHVARYCDVVGQPRGDRLPLLYPHLLGFGLQLKLMSDRSFPLPPLGLVHVTNEVSATGPVHGGRELDLTVHAGALRPHPRGRVVDLITTVREDGAAIWTETSTYLHRERVPPVPATGATDPAGAGAGPEAGPPLHFCARWTLPGDLGRRYAAASGDVNPIHLSSWTARPLGFPRAIAHGMWSAAAALGALEGRLPDALTYSVRFLRPITLPASVRLFTRVTGERVVAEVRGRDGDDRVHLLGEVRPAAMPQVTTILPPGTDRESASR